VGTEIEHRERVVGAAARWLEAARAHITAWSDAHPDGVPSVRQEQATQAERLARMAYDGALAARRRHLRGETHDEVTPQA
jgi:hypothetical protein